MTVTVELMGGLGNQLFQYAAARAIAARHHSGVVLDVSGYVQKGLRRYELGAYGLPAAITGYAPSMLSGFVSKIMPFGRSGKRTYQEPHFHFDAQLSAQALPLRMQGYWQSEKYFSDIADILRRELTPRLPLQGRNADYAEKIAATNAVSLHVRRGDYVSDARTSAYHGTCTPDYYARALQYMSKHVCSPHVVVFSDDIGWAKDNLKIPFEVTYVEANDAESGVFDLELMRRCKHHIIANSSFSWWGAWLNASPDKIIVAPARWFAESPHDTRDLIPPSWVQM